MKPIQNHHEATMKLNPIVLSTNPCLQILHQHGLCHIESAFLPPLNQLLQSLEGFKTDCDGMISRVSSMAQRSQEWANNQD